MAETSSDIDYLVGTKPYPKIPSFAEEVREAFALERGCLKDQDIAKLLSMSPGRVSQILNQPEILKAETVQRIIGSLTSVIHRKNILKAWQRECFGDELAEGDPTTLIAETGIASTIKRIDRLVRTMRPDRALKVTEQALRSDHEPEFRRLLLDRAFYLYQRLDQSGDAMGVAQKLYNWGKEDGSREKIATALAMRVRILRSIDGVSAKVLSSAYGDAREVIGTLPIPKPGASPHITATPQMIKREHLTNVLTYEEWHGGADSFLEESLTAVESSMSPEDSSQKKSSSFYLQARIHLALRNYFKAEDILEESFQKGDISLGSDAQSAIIMAKIIAARGNID